MEEDKKTVDKFGEYLISRIKLPILSTYLIILIIYNWKILLYLIFNNQIIDLKIRYIVNKYQDYYFENIAIPILIAFIYNLLFPILQVAINYVFSRFKKINKDLTRNEELDDAKHKFEIQQSLTGQQPLERLQNNIDLLTSENQKLIADNKNLLELIKEENKRVKSEDNFRKTISLKREKELDNISKILLSKFQEFTSEEKSVFLDLINYFDSKDKSLSRKSIENVSLYSEYAETPLDLLEENNVLKRFLSNNGNITFQASNIGFELLEYFKENFSDKLY